MMTDPIADMLTRIRNAQLARHKTVRVPKSKLKTHIATILKNEGYVVDVTDAAETHHPELEITLRYVDEKPLIQRMVRESRPGQRVYVKRDDIPSVRNGLGLAIVSTSKGVMSGREARSANVGGELLCTIY